MSTPSKKYADPSELSDHLECNEHGNLEPDQQSEHEGARSPYAPKPAHLRSTMPPSALGLDVSGGSAYAPRRARSAPSPEAHADTYEPAGEPDREEGSLEEASPETASEHAASLCPDTPAVTQPAADPFEPETAVSLQPGQARDGARDDRRAPQRNDERRDTRIDDRDLARLEESVRWMQQRRQAAAMRLPRATGLPPLNPPLSDPMRRRAPGRANVSLDAALARADAPCATAPESGSPSELMACGRSRMHPGGRGSLYADADRLLAVVAND